MTKVICGRCKVEPELVENADGNAEVVCPSCGQRDNANDAARIAGEQAMDAAARHFQSAVRSGVVGSKFVIFEAKRVPNRTFNWHAA